MKKILVILCVVALLAVFVAPVFAHPTKGPDSMPGQALKGLHTAVFELPDFPKHIIVGLMIRTGVPCHD